MFDPESTPQATHISAMERVFVYPITFGGAPVSKDFARLLEGAASGGLSFSEALVYYGAEPKFPLLPASGRITMSAEDEGFLFYGWYGPEQWGDIQIRWAGGLVKIGVRVEPEKARQIRSVSVSLFPLPSIDGTERSFEIRVNRKTVCEVQGHANAFSLLEIPIVLDPGANVIEIRSGDEVTKPLKDPRKLSFAVRSISFNE